MAVFTLYQFKTHYGGGLREGDVLIKKWRMLVKKQIRVDILVTLKVEMNDGEVRNREKKKEEGGPRRY